MTREWTDDFDGQLARLRKREALTAQGLVSA